MRAIGILAILTILISASGLTSSSARVETTGAHGEARPVQASQQAELAIIVNKSNPTDNISYSELREYFLAERSHWGSGGGKVRIVMRAPGQAEREAVLHLIYNMNEKGFTSPRLPGQDDKPRLELKTELLNEREIDNAQLGEHCGGWL